MANLGDCGTVQAQLELSLISAKFNEKYSRSNIAQFTIFRVEVYIFRVWSHYDAVKGNIKIQQLKQVFTFAECQFILNWSLTYNYGVLPSFK